MGEIVFPGTPIDYLIANAEPWKHTYKLILSRQIYVWDICIYIYVTTINEKICTWKRSKKGIWNGFEGRKGMGQIM